MSKLLCRREQVAHQTNLAEVMCVSPSVEPDVCACVCSILLIVSKGTEKAIKNMDEHHVVSSTHSFRTHSLNPSCSKGKVNIVNQNCHCA